jgi:hypothetical protein
LGPGAVCVYGAVCEYTVRDLVKDRLPFVRGMGSHSGIGVGDLQGSSMVA